MQRARSVFANGIDMGNGAVSLVLVEAVVRVRRGALLHYPVASDFRHDGRGGDARFQAISADDGLMRHGKTVSVFSVDKEQRRGRFAAKLCHCETHGLFVGAQNADAFNLFGFHDADAEGAVI